ncbi:MAG: caspase family protein [Deferribacterales bacterium]
MRVVYKPLILLTIFLISLSALAEDVLIRLETLGHMNQVETVLVTKSGDIITGSKDTDIKVWSPDGRLKEKFLGEIDQVGMGKVYTIALSPDERYLAAGGIFGHYNDIAVGDIRVYDFRSGRLIKLLHGHDLAVQSLKFSDDGGFLVSGSGDTTVKVWKMSDFSLLRTIKSHKVNVTSVDVFKSGRGYNIVSGDFEGSVSVDSLNTGKNIAKITAGSWVTDVAVSADDIAVGSSGGNVIIYDHRLKHKKTINRQSSTNDLKYSEDGRYLAVSSIGSPAEISVYQARERYVKRSGFSGIGVITSGVSFADNNTLAVSGGIDNSIYLVDIDKKSIIKQIKGVGDAVYYLGIKGDEILYTRKDVSTDQFPEEYKVINLKDFSVRDYKPTDKIRLDLPHVNGQYSLEAVADDAGNKKGVKNAKLLINKNGQLYSSIKRTDNEGIVHRNYGWYKNMVVSASSNGNLDIYNIDGVKLASLLGHSGEVVPLGLDGDRLVSSGSDQTIKIWDLKQVQGLTPVMVIDEGFVKQIMDVMGWTRETVLANAKEIKKRVGFGVYVNSAVRKILPELNLFVTGDNQYVAWTYDGFFDASPKGAEYVGYHINRGRDKEGAFVSMDALYSVLYRPDLVQRALNGENLGEYSKKINLKNLLASGLPPQLKILNKPHEINGSNINLNLQVCPRTTGGYDNLAIMINGIPVSVTQNTRALKRAPVSDRPECFTYGQTISLIDGENVIGFKGTNKGGNIESKPDYITVYANGEKRVNSTAKLAEAAADGKKRDLYVLAVAVNNYDDNDLDLKYSLSDADGMLSSVTRAAEPLFDKIHVTKLYDADVTKEKIDNAFSSVKSGRDDVFLLYIAGHGVTDKFNGDYYFIPADFRNKDDDISVRRYGIGQKDLMMGLSKVQALKSVVMLDTCESGSFAEASLQKTATNRISKATGRAVISASSANDVALEGYEGHGAFTYTLLKAIGGEGYGKDNLLTVNELSEYAEAVLPNITAQKWGYRQKPQVSMFGTDFFIGEKN